MSLHKDNLQIISTLKKKQEEVIPLALNEMYLNCSPSSNWVWWVFPNDISLLNQPEPIINLTTETFLLYLSSYPQKWKYLIQRIYKTISYIKHPITTIFNNRCQQQHIKRSIKFILRTLSKLDDHEFDWLYDCFRFFKQNFNNYQYPSSIL